MTHKSLWIRALAAGLALMVAASACSVRPVEPAAQPGSDQPAPAAAEKVVVRWSVWGSAEELASHQAVADAYMAAHPNVTINIEHTPWDGYHDRLKTLVAAGDPGALADVIFLGQDYNRYAESGVLEPLDDWIAKTNYDLSDYWPTVIERARVNGKIYGLQRDLDLRLLYYNKAMFDKAGAAYPNENWTWDDWAEAARELTIIEPNGRIAQQGIGMETGKWSMLLAQTNGGYLDDPRNPSRCALEDANSLEAVTFFAGLIRDKAAMTPADLKQIGGDAAAFQQGRVAMIVQNSSRAPTFNAAGMDYDVAPIPIPKGGARVNNVGGARFVMNSAARNKEAAWAFLSWLQGREGGQAIYTRRGDMFPILRSVANSDDFLKLPIKPDNRAAFVVEASSVRLFTFGDFPEYDEMNDLIIEPNLQRIWGGEAEAEATVRDICQKVNEFLKQNGYPRP